MLKYFFLLVFCLPVFAADVTASWNANTESDLGGYKVYYGTQSQNYSNVMDVGKVLSVTITNLDRNKTYYFALKTYDTTGNESNFSSEVQLFIPPLPDTTPPNAPTNVKIVLSSTQSSVKQN